MSSVRPPRADGQSREGRASLQAGPSPPPSPPRGGKGQAVLVWTSGLAVSSHGGT